MIEPRPHPARGAWFASLIALSLTSPAAAQQDGLPPAPRAGATINVIWVAMDTTRADHLGAYGYSRATSPNLDRLAGEAVLFERCHTQANETLTAFASAFTSRLPSEIAPLSYQSFRVPATADTLTSVLHLYGYQTGGFVAGGHMVRDFGHDRGFDVYQDNWHFGSLHQTIPPALAWLDQRDATRPFFLFVHGYDAHGPYCKPLYFERMFDPDYQGIADDLMRTDDPLEIEKVWQGRYYPAIQGTDVFRPMSGSDLQVLDTDIFSLLALQDPAAGVPVTPRDIEHIVAHYDGSIAYADVQLGLLMAALRERGLLETSVVIVMGDHGEDLYEHGHANHRISLHDASGHVPLLIRLPGAAHGGERVPTPVDLLDIMPTVLELTDVTPPAGIRGHSLLRLLDGGIDPQRSVVTVSEGILPMASARSEDLRLIVGGALPGTDAFQALVHATPLEDPAFTLFLLRDGRERPLDLADPANRELAQPLLEAMRAAYDHPARLSDGLTPYVDPALLEIMRDKGYW